jgi:predicted acetyltransferase
VSIEIRSPREDEFEAVFAAANAAFGEAARPEDVERVRPLMPLGRILAGFDCGRPVGVSAALQFELTIPGGAAPAAGVTWVGVLPSHRRRGLLREFMLRQLDQFHEAGEPLAVLWASEAPIYGRFGYGLASFNADLDAEAARFAFRDDPGRSGSIRLVSAEGALEVLPPLYERVRLSRPGYLSRSQVWWGAKVADPEHRRGGAGPKFNAVLELDGEPAGFARYRVDGKWERATPQGRLEVIEVQACSLDALRELWRFLFSIDLIATVSADWFDPGSPLFLMTVEPRRLHVTLSDGLWLRLVDVAEALRIRSYAADASVVFDVADEQCAWNRGRFRAGADAGPTDEPAEIRVGVADLASLYLGGFDAAQLRAAGRLEELVPGAVDRANALFRTPEPPFCPEEF